jgi:hypothetical protein
MGKPAVAIELSSAERREPESLARRRKKRDFAYSSTTKNTNGGRAGRDPIRDAETD